MTRRINGIGTTISPFPAKHQYSISMHWFTFFYIPLIPLGWIFVEGHGDQQYKIIREIKFTEAKKVLGTKGIIMTLAFGYAAGIIYLAGFSLLMYIIYLIKQ